MNTHEHQLNELVSEDNITSNERVIELDPEKIEGSFVADRLSKAAQNDDSFSALVTSIRSGGQQVPVLVRPHPDAEKRNNGWFQAAYGHRRIHAARLLKIPVKALQRDLSDEELVLAQGKENGERRNLSFIERAFFAKGLLKRGIDRTTIQQALSVDKTQMSRLLQIAEAVPARIVRAIGPAPKAGRPRWLALADLLKPDAGQVKAIDEIGKQCFADADSDARFQMLFARLSRASVAKAKACVRKQEIRDGKGAMIARLKRSGLNTTLHLNEKSHPGFADYLANALPNLARVWAKDGMEM